MNHKIHQNSSKNSFLSPCRLLPFCKRDLRDRPNRLYRLSIIIILVLFACAAYANDKALVLQEISWLDVQNYLKTCDMVIIPLGSTEQHGPHLPLGTDFFEALELSKMVSQKTGVLVAPILIIGYSEYHSGFPGTFSLKPETMVQVLNENIDMLIKYGFRRFMFLNYHGGNSLIEDTVIQRINRTTKAVAVAVGIESPLQKEEPNDTFDWHAGKHETSMMLYLKPELVRIERAEKPVLHFTQKMQELQELAKKHPELDMVYGSYFATLPETGKGGASHEFSSNGIWSVYDPKTAASKKLGEQEATKMIEPIVKFIESWKLVK